MHIQYPTRKLFDANGYFYVGGISVEGPAPVLGTGLRAHSHRRGPAKNTGPYGVMVTVARHARCRRKLSEG